METPVLDGTFATDRLRRVERGWQRVGVATLAGIVVAALAGLVGERALVGRSAVVYLFLLAVFRVSGRRTLAQVTTFDLILVLILGDATQQAVVGTDATVGGAIVAVSTLVLLDMGLAVAKHRWPAVDVLIDGLPLPLAERGRLHEARMASERVSRDDVLTAAREQHGLSRLEEVEFAVLEQDGAISIGRRGHG